jgi:hypothetical protein
MERMAFAKNGVQQLDNHKQKTETKQQGYTKIP